MRLSAGSYLAPLMPASPQHPRWAPVRSRTPLVNIQLHSCNTTDWKMAVKSQFVGVIRSIGAFVALGDFYIYLCDLEQQIMF